MAARFAGAPPDGLGVSDEEIRKLLDAVGLLKFPRVYARRMGWLWRPGHDGGAPPAWYAAFRGELGDQLERVLRG